MISNSVRRWIREEIFQQVPVNICVIDRNYRIIEANDNFTRTFGESQDRHCYEAYKNHSEVCPGCNSTKTFSDGEVRVSQETGIDRDGNEIQYLVHMAPLVEEDGSIPYVIEMSTDISKMTSLQKKVQQQREHYRLLFNEVPCFISIQDRKFNLLETNRLFKEYFGESEGRPCYEVYKHRSEPCYPCPVAQTFDDGEVHRVEEVLTSHDGTRINVICYTAPIRNSEGEITAVMEMATDITRIRQLQSQLTSIGMLVSSISHGVKGLLMGIDGGIYAVDTGIARDDRGRIDQGWNMVKRNVNKVRNMVLNILYYAKDRDLEWETVSAADLAEEVLGISETRAREHGIELVRKFDSGAGSLEADRQAVRTLLVNILENAIDACRVDGDGDKHCITFAVEGDNDNVTFSITDDGIGMDRETREKIFTLFFSSKGSGGTGLGLFISNKIALKHGGDISVFSELGSGSTFTVTLPRQKTVVDTASEDGLPSDDELLTPSL